MAVGIANIIREKVKDAAAAYDYYFEKPKNIVMINRLVMRILSLIPSEASYLKLPWEINSNVRRLFSLVGVVKILHSVLNYRFTWQRVLLNSFGMINFIAIAVRFSKSNTPSSILKQMKKLLAGAPIIRLITYKYWRKGPTKGEGISKVKTEANKIANALFLIGNLFKVAQRINLLIEAISGYDIGRPSPCMRCVMDVAYLSCELGQYYVRNSYS